MSFVYSSIDHLRKKKKTKKKSIIYEKNGGVCFWLVNGLIFFSPSKNEKKRVPL